MTGIVKDTRQRFSRPRHSGDIMLDAKGPNLATTQEKLIVYGGFMDYTGSGGVPTKQQLMGAGMANEFQGTNAYLEGARKPNLGSLGEHVETTRLRTRKIYLLPEQIRSSP